MTKQNGALTVDLDYSEFGQISTLPANPNLYSLIYDTQLKNYTLAPVSLFGGGGGGGGGLSDAPIDGSDYVRNSTNWQHPSFLQSGTGAVLRAMLDKARENVSVFDFGAVGDGITDDAAAINRALAAATPGTVVVLAARTASGTLTQYLVDSADLTIPNGVQLSGAWHPGVNSTTRYTVLAQLGGAIILNRDLHDYPERIERLEQIGNLPQGSGYSRHQPIRFFRHGDQHRRRRLHGKLSVRAWLWSIAYKQSLGEAANPVRLGR